MPVWVPAGDFKLTGEILVPSSVTIQGAGMWHTNFVGDEALYVQAARRVRFTLRDCAPIRRPKPSRRLLRKRSVS